MLTRAAKPDAFCVDLYRWRLPDGTLVPVTEIYRGPDEDSSRGPFYHCDGDVTLYRADSLLTLVVRRWRLPSGARDEPGNRGNLALEILASRDAGRTWRPDFQAFVGREEAAPLAQLG